MHPNTTRKIARIIAGLLAGMMILSLLLSLVGCGQTDASDAPVTEQITEEKPRPKRKLLKPRRLPRIPHPKKRLSSPQKRQPNPNRSPLSRKKPLLRMPKK